MVVLVCASQVVVAAPDSTVRPQAMIMVNGCDAGHDRGSGIKPNKNVSAMTPLRRNTSRSNILLVLYLRHEVVFSGFPKVWFGVKRRVVHMTSPEQEEADPYRGTRPQEILVSDVVKLPFSVFIQKYYFQFKIPTNSGNHVLNTIFNTTPGLVGQPTSNHRTNCMAVKPN